MTPDLTRRDVLGMLAAGSIGLAPKGAGAQSAGLLEKVRKAGVIRIGITNGPPYASLNPDGSVDGVAPTIVRLVMERLGVPKVEGIVATYGQLVPGLQAGRWDMIGADMTVTKERCEQVTYTDPFTSDHAAFAYIASELRDPPRTIKETGVKVSRIGMIAGTYMLPAVKAAQTRPDTIAIFPDSPNLMEALFAGRIEIAFSGILVLRDYRNRVPKPFEIVYPMPDDELHPAGGAFRKGDTDLIQAFEAEYRKMKQSGEAEKIVTGFGFDVFNGHLEMTAEKACRDSPV